MAKLDYYDVYVQIGKPTETHYELKLRVLFEAGDNQNTVISNLSDRLQSEALRIANAAYIETIDDAL